MGAIRVLAPRAWLIGLLFGVVLAGCGTILPSSLPTPAAQVVPGPTAGPVDLALGRIDPFGILRALDGGSACREEPLAGAGIHEFICPRSGNDRNIYFLFADAFQVELTKAGATLGTVAKESSDATAPCRRPGRSTGMRRSARRACSG